MRELLQFDSFKRSLSIIIIFFLQHITALWIMPGIIVINRLCEQRITADLHARSTANIFLLFAKVLWALLRTEEDALLYEINFHFLICALSSSVALTWMFLANSSHTPVSYTLHFSLKRTLHIIHWSIHKGRVHLLSLILDCYFVTTPPSLDCK